MLFHDAACCFVAGPRTFPETIRANTNGTAALVRTLAEALRLMIASYLWRAAFAASVDVRARYCCMPTDR